MKFSAMLAGIALILISTATQAVAQPHEGGVVITEKLKEKYPGLMTVLTSDKVRNLIQRHIGRGESKLTEISMVSRMLNNYEYTFEFKAANGGYIGSTSFTATATLSGGGYKVSIRENPVLERVGG